MKQSLPICLLVSLAVSFGLFARMPDCAAQASSAPGIASASDSIQQHWAQAKAQLARGAYRDALQELEIILTLSPGDPLAWAYRTLCQKRLREHAEFVRLSPTDLTALQETLRREEEAQRRRAAEVMALERQAKREQEKWQAEVVRLQREMVKEEAAKRRQQKLAQATRRRQARQALRELTRKRKIKTAPPPAPAKMAEAIKPPPEAQRPPLAAPEAKRPQATIELAPVRVPTKLPKQPELLPPAPAVLPGALQIFAEQMSVLQDQQIAKAKGNVLIVFEGGLLSCDEASLFTDTKDVYAKGRVRLERPPEVFRGEVVHYNLDSKKGRFLEATAFKYPWYEHGRVTEHIAEGVLRVRPGYVTSCEFEPPHFRFQGRSATVFAPDKIVRGRHVTFAVEEFPLIYLPWLTIADRQTPFFLIPGKNKIWGQFALGGYRYEWPEGHRGTVRLDWRRAMTWGTGLDHRFESAHLGKGLLRLYYNDEHNIRRPEDDLPKGAGDRRYRVLYRHNWQMLPDTTLVADLQKFSDQDFRKEFLFHDEFVRDDASQTFVSLVASDPNFALTLLARQRMNRFESVTEAYPDATLQINPQQIGQSNLYSDTKLTLANLQTKPAHSDADTDLVKLNWFQQFSYALNLFRPILVTPRVGVQQTYYTKDKQGGSERPDGNRDLISGQFSGGLDASLKLFRIFPVTTDWLRLNINWLRHVLTPTVSYSYVHQPTAPGSILNFAAAASPTNQLFFGLENKLQTKRSPPKGTKGKPQGADLARLLISLPYTFRGNANKQGGRLGDWAFDLEIFPWPWLRIESDWSYPSHFVKGSRDRRLTGWNLDVALVGDRRGLGWHERLDAKARETEKVFAAQRSQISFLPLGRWSLGYSHRYSNNDKTEDVVQLDWRLSEKWQVSAFNRLTFKEVAGSSKRFNNVREYQYVLFRDLHDWIAEFLYRVDREYGEEIFFTLSLKAYPQLPIEYETAYHQPKFGSQSSPFSPVR